MLVPKSSDAKQVQLDGPVDVSSKSTVPGRPLRVLVVAARFLPDLGGIETHVYEVTRRMATKRELDLTVLTTDRSGTRPSREDFGNFVALRCRAYPRRKDYYFAPAVYQHILSGAYDLIHCQGIHTAVPVLAMLAARRRQIPYVVTFHTGGHSSGLRGRLRGAQWRALAPLLRGATTLVAVSRFEQRTFQNMCPAESRFRIVQNGGELPDSVLRSKVLPGRIVSSGRLERYKGHQRLIEALPIVQQSIPHASLQILGSGPYESHLRTLVNKLGLGRSVTIEFIAPDDRERMARTLSRAALVAAMSEYEAHPVAIMEALALGIPAIGLDTAGIGDLVEDGLVEGVPQKASAATLARTLIRMLQSTRTTRTANLPTWDTAASDLAQIYMEAVEATPEASARWMHRV
jgi:glycosyltransferase involved in cell wall biosynthesis